MGLKVIKFEAEWCGPCKAMAPVWNKVAGDTEGVAFETVDIDDNPELAAQMQIRVVPTIVFVKDGDEIDRAVGMHSEKDLRGKIEGLK